MSELAKHCCPKKVAVVVVAGIAVYGAAMKVREWERKKQLLKKASEKKDLENAIIKQELEQSEKYDEEERNKILNMKANELIRAAQQGELDPVHILRAYIHKACTVTQKFNSVTGINRDAENNAKQLKNGNNNTHRPLYGLPFSIKECCDIKGMDTTIGLVNLIGIPAKEDCVLVKVLKHCGAIPFAKTNLPQLMFSFESSNPVYGETGNPHNVDFTPGGSSSGEGSLIGSGGSLLGFGTDTGGSIRCPAHMSGVCGLKPTLNRLSIVGLGNILPGSNCVTTSVGPLATDVDTLVLAMRAILCPLMFELDRTVPPIPFNDEVYSSKKRLRIGYYLDDGYMEPVPAVKRAVVEAKEALEKAGHELIPFHVPRIADAMKILVSLFFADAGEFNQKRLKIDFVGKRLENLYQQWSLSDLKCKLLSMFKSPRLRQDLLLHKGGDRSTTRLWSLARDAAAFVDHYTALWLNLNLDAMICPAFPVVACPKGGISNVSAMASHTALYNMLNYPAGVVPVTKVNQKDIEDLENYKGHYQDEWDQHIKEVTKGSIGMPVGVQCVAPTWQDELCLRVMHEVEEQLKK
uniref:fatty-acid amide hydrolase 1-like n=1 Tax=Ciona intestinalis TaxID=7719 RepID=UPI0000603543|nr:fatty-acid amide hydrolase 1-like [Ciona intestinalis]|eukprot:XP_026691817.1 fatty-acid amide hydrolase 1-like [Ciona intestinalis]